nr:RDD family protein [Microbacterium invictum]
MIPAPFGRRVLSTVFEILLVALLQLPMLIVTLPALLQVVAEGDPAALFGRNDLLWVGLAGLVSSVLTTAFIIVQLVLNGRRGVTFGKMLTGIRVVNVRTLERPKFWRGAVVRYLIMWGSFIVVLIGPLLVVALSPLFDPEKRGRGWPDRVAQTWFVDARRGLNPYDAKRMRIARKAAATDLVDERSVLPSLATSAGHRGPDVYIPVTRSSGGVLGAARPEPTAGPGEEPPAIPTVVVPSAFTPQPPAMSSPDAAPGVAVPPVVRPAASTPSPTAWAPPQLLPSDPAPAAARPAAAAVPAPAAPAPAVAPPASLAAHAPDAAPVPVTVRVSLMLDSGETIDIDAGGALIGRAPAAGPADAGLALVPVHDPSMSVSKTHLAVLRSDGIVVVVDCGSTNGSALSRGGTEQPLTAGEKTPLADGDTIRFGDRFAQVRISRG